MITTHYKVPGLGLRFALVTDLHDMNYGNLVELIKGQKPNAIFLAGDILERMNDCEESIEEQQAKAANYDLFTRTVAFLLNLFTSKDFSKTHYGIDFLSKVAGIAPVFYSLGNHELYFTDEDKALFSEHGITVLDNADVIADIKGKKILIGGLSTKPDMDWLREFSEKHGYKVLLCHDPAYYRNRILDTDMDTFDLVLGGHYHGGQWRILGRAVYATGLGFMKPDMVGKFGKLIISAGVGNTSSLPRLGNPRELIIIES